MPANTAIVVLHTSLTQSTFGSSLTKVNGAFHHVRSPDDRYKPGPVIPSQNVVSLPERTFSSGQRPAQRHCVPGLSRLFSTKPSRGPGPRLEAGRAEDAVTGPPQKGALDSHRGLCSGWNCLFSSRLFPGCALVARGCPHLPVPNLCFPRSAQGWILITSDPGQGHLLRGLP